MNIFSKITFFFIKEGTYKIDRKNSSQELVATKKWKNGKITAKVLIRGAWFTGFLKRNSLKDSTLTFFLTEDGDKIKIKNVLSIKKVK